MQRVNRQLRPLDYQLIQIKQSAFNSQTPATLQTVEYKCQILNNILKIYLIQTFKSLSSYEFSETQYFFPIHQNICLESFEARYNDKKVKGIVKAKEEAQKEYEQNKNQGNFVSYAETQKIQRDEYVKIMIGNLPPGVEVKIELSFSQQLESILNKYYVANIPLQYVEDEISVKLGKNVLSLDLFCTGKITYAKSKDQSVEQTMIDENTARFTLSQAIFQKNTDFQLIFSYEGMFNPQVILGSSKVYHEDSVKRNLFPIRNSAMISFIPNFNEELTKEIDDTVRTAIMNGDDILSDEFKQKVNQELIDHLNSSKSEFIFLLDRSGSMSGQPIQKAVDALILFLKSLPNDSYFNVVSFGTNFQKLFPHSQQYDSKTMDQAISIIKKFSADLGGTQIYEPLQDIFNNQQRIQGYNKQIFLLTDGEVSQPENVVNLIKKNNKFNRVHSIGFGSGADKYLIEQSSVAGKGIHKNIDIKSDLSEVVINMLSNSISPTYDDLTLIYDKNIFESTYPKSTDFPCVFKDEILNIHLFFKPLVDIQSINDDQKVVQIEYYDSKFKQNVKKEIRLEMSDCFTCNTEIQESVFKLGKQLYLNENMKQEQKEEELIQQAIDFQLMTQKTALVCVIESLNDEKQIIFQNFSNKKIYSNDQCLQTQSFSQKSCYSQNSLTQFYSQLLKKPSQNSLSNNLFGSRNQQQLDSKCNMLDLLDCSFEEQNQNINTKNQTQNKDDLLDLFGFDSITSQDQKQYNKQQNFYNSYNQIDNQTQQNNNQYEELFSEFCSIQHQNQLSKKQNNNLDRQSKNCLNDLSFQQCKQSKSELISNNYSNNQFQHQFGQPNKQTNQNYINLLEVDSETEQEGVQKQIDINQQTNKSQIIPSLKLESILQLVDSEGVWKYNYRVIQQCSSISQQNINKFILYFYNNDAFMTTFILCILEQFYNSDKQIWILISKKAINYIKKNLKQNNQLDQIKQELKQDL